MADDTKNGILKDEPKNNHRRRQQGFAVLRPAFSCDCKVYAPAGFARLPA